MNLKRYRRLCAFVCYATIVAFLTPQFARPAMAQSQAPMQVGVVDFRNDSGVQGGLLARFATDAVVIEMSKSNRFDVITRSQIESQMKELGLSAPLSAVEINRLGEALAAEAMIEGSVKSVEVRGSAGNRRAAVTIVVRMVDVASGEVINGAVQTGYSSYRVGDTANDDKLISEAIDNAAYLAVKTMVDYVIPEATVQNTIRTSEVLLNKGARDGIRVGMRMIVTRDREIIGQLTVVQVDPNNSTGSIIKQTRGVRPEDKARAVFDMPALEQVKASPGSQSGVPAATPVKGQGMKKASKFLLALGVIFLAASVFRSNGETVGGVTAEPTLAPDGTAGVRVSWDSGSLGNGLNVTRYQIWRDADPDPVGNVDPATGQLWFLDTSATVGVAHQYYISATHSTGAGGIGAGTAQTQKKAANGRATPIMRIPAASLTTPVFDSQQNLHKVTFQWLSVLGADAYVVEVSTDPIFANPEFVSDPVNFSPFQPGQTVTLTVNEALFTLFRKLPSTQPIYWRVGARATGDSPGPIPPAGRSNMRYIYSEISQFRPVATITP